MSEEDILKECTELAENEHHELGDCWDEEYSSSAIFGLIILYKQTKKELNNLKEIEKSHKTDNGLLKQELDMQIEHNKELEAPLKQTQDSWFEDTQKLEQLKLNDKEKEIIKSYRNVVKETGVDTGWVVCNPAIMWSKYFISKDKIKQEIKNIERRMEMATNSTEYQKLHCAQEYLRGLLWEV